MEMGTISHAERLRFPHFRVGPTPTEGSDNDVHDGEIALTDTVQTMATVADDRRPATLSSQTLGAVRTSEAASHSLAPHPILQEHIVVNLFF